MTTYSVQPFKESLSLLLFKEEDFLIFKEEDFFIFKEEGVNCDMVAYNGRDSIEKREANIWTMKRITDILM